MGHEFELFCANDALGQVFQLDSRRKMVKPDPYCYWDHQRTRVPNIGLKGNLASADIASRMRRVVNGLVKV